MFSATTKTGTAHTAGVEMMEGGREGEREGGSHSGVTRIYPICIYIYIHICVCGCVSLYLKASICDSSLSRCAEHFA